MEGPLEEANLVRADEIRPAPRASRREPASRPAFSGQKSQPDCFFYPWWDLWKNKELCCPHLSFILGTPWTKSD